MDIVKKAETYTVVKKRNGRFGVKASNGSWINGEEKVKILLAEKLIKAPAVKAKVEETTENTEEVTAEA